MPYVGILLLLVLLGAPPAAPLAPQRAAAALRGAEDPGALSAGTLLSRRSSIHPEAQRILAGGPGGARDVRATGDALSTVFGGAALGAIRRAAAEACAGAGAAGRAPGAGPEQQAQQQPHPNAAGPAAFDPARARLLSALQSIAYCADAAGVAAWACARCARVPGFVPEVYHHDPEWDLSGYAGYLPSLGAKVVVFKGSDSGSWMNWVNNMRGGRGRCEHGGLGWIVLVVVEGLW